MGTITIQKTSKKLKGWLIYSALTMMLGVLWMLAAALMCWPGLEYHLIGGASTCVFAVLWFLFTKFLIWWNHG